MNRRRAPKPATTAEEERGIARAAYIERFLKGAAIRRNLAALWQSCEGRAAWPPELAWLRLSSDPADLSLARGCEQIAETLRLPDLADNVYAWLSDTHQSGWTIDPEDQAKAMKAAMKAAPGAFATFSDSAAVVGDVEVSRTERDIGGRRIGEITTRPIVLLGADNEWDPGHESRQDAERRIVAAVRRGLDRIETHAETVGYRFPDTRSNLARDIDWLVERVRDGRSWDDITNRAQADDEQVYSSDTVRHAAERVAKLIGLRSDILGPS